MSGELDLRPRSASDSSQAANQAAIPGKDTLTSSLPPAQAVNASGPSDPASSFGESAAGEQSSRAAPEAVRVKTNGLYVWRAPNSSNLADIVGTLARGSSVVVGGQVGAWLRIQYRGQDAYISSYNYYVEPIAASGAAPDASAHAVSTATPAPAAAEPAANGHGQMRVTANGLNVRSAPSKDGDNIVGLLHHQAIVEASGRSGEWLKIDHRGKPAFVFGAYVEPVAHGAPAVPSHSAAATSPAAGHAELPHVPAAPAAPAAPVAPAAPAAPAHAAAQVHTPDPTPAHVDKPATTAHAPDPAHVTAPPTAAADHKDEAAKPKEAPKDAKKPKSHGFAKYGGGTVLAVLTRLANAGRLKITGDQIAQLDAVAQVETGGQVAGVDTTDDMVVSIGFHQVVLGHKSIEAVMLKAPEAFAKHGLTLDMSKTYNDPDWSKPHQIQGVADADDLRGHEWGDKFFAASLEDDVIIAIAEFALAEAKQVAKITTDNGGTVDLFNDNTARAWILEVHNNRPGYTGPSVAKAVAAGAQSAKDRDKFLDILSKGIIDAYVELEPLTFYHRWKAQAKNKNATAEQAAAMLVHYKQVYEPIGRTKATHIVTKMSRHLEVPKIDPSKAPAPAAPAPAVATAAPAAPAAPAHHDAAPAVEHHDAAPVAPAHHDAPAAPAHHDAPAPAAPAHHDAAVTTSAPAEHAPAAPAAPKPAPAAPIAAPAQVSTTAPQTVDANHHVGADQFETAGHTAIAKTTKDEATVLNNIAKDPRRLDPAWLLTAQTNLHVTDATGAMNTETLRAMRAKANTPTLDAHGIMTESFLATLAPGQPFFAGTQTGAHGNKPPTPGADSNKDKTVQELGFASFAEYQRLWGSDNVEFMGHDFRQPAHPYLRARLKVAEAYLRQRIKGPNGEQLNDKQITKQLGWNTSGKGSFGNASYGHDPKDPNTHQHAMGLAIDIEPGQNAYMFESASGWMSYFEKLSVYAQKMFGGDILHPKTMHDWSKEMSTEELYQKIKSGSDAFGKLLTYSHSIGGKEDNPDLLDRVAKMGYKGADAKTAAHQIALADKDFHLQEGRRDAAAPMNMNEEIVIALRDVAGLAWGAAEIADGENGDMMHFDCRLTKFGNDVYNAGYKHKPH